MSGEIGIGMLGGGMVSQIGHLPFYRADPRCRVVAVAESRPSLVEHLRGQGLRVVTDHRALLEDDDIQAVVISAPRPATGPLTLAALEAGKHVLAEKPMAHTVEQAQRLVAAAEARGLIYAVGFMKRCDPGVQAARAEVRRVLETGALGALLSARIYDHSRSTVLPPPSHKRPEESRTERFETWPLWPDWLPDDRRETYAWFLNFASHDVNLLNFLLPQEKTVLAAEARPAGALTALMRAGEALITLEASRTAAGTWIEGAELLFEEGRISLSIPSPLAADQVARVRIDDGRRGVTDGEVDSGLGWCFERQARGFVDALAGKAEPATSGAQGLADMQLTERIWRHIAGAA